MSKEHLSESHEHKSESLSAEAESRLNLERIQKKAQSAELESKNIDSLQEQVEQQAVSGKEITIGERESTHHDSPIGVQRELKADAYKRSLQKIRKELPWPDRALSKLTHQPYIEAISEFSGKTIARPSGILGGGVISTLGSGALLYIAKHYGFKYNFLAFLILFMAGFAVGLIVELLLRLLGVTQKSKSL